MYKNRLYSVNAAGVEGVQHIQNRDFSQVIEQAQLCKGFDQTFEPARYTTVGFNHRAIVPQDIIDGVQSMNLGCPEEFTAYNEG